MPPTADEQRRWELVLAHRDRLVRLARRRLPDRCAVDAEDIAHEAMLRAVNFAALDPERVGQFLTTVTLRQCADVYRHKARQASVGHRSGQRSAADIADDVCDSMEAQWLLRQLTTLPEREAAVMLAAVDGETRAATAARLGATLKALESAAARARKSLRAAATLGAALAGVLIRRGAHGRTSLSTSLAAVTIFAVGATLGLHLPSPTQHSPSPVRSPSRTGDKVSTPTRLLASNQPFRSHVPAARSGPPGRSTPVTEQVLFSTPEAETPVGQLDSGPTVTQYRDGRTFVQSVEYCLDGHLSVSTSVIGCPPPRTHSQ